MYKYNAEGRGGRGRSGGRGQSDRGPPRAISSSTLRMNTVLSTSEASDSGREQGDSQDWSRKHWVRVQEDLDQGSIPSSQELLELTDSRLTQDKAAKVLAINALFNPRFTAITAQTHPNAGERASAKAAVRKKQYGFVDAVELNDASMRSGLQALKKARNDREKEHKDMVEACIACYARPA
jgi:hypothetical protein